ncbi:MAG: PEGA domain-containing protein [Pseudomonadales bacterium]|nr:PEGA domain-containing protein [Candidatus Woesebacteria bacterium]MCB9800577.1 PEGA domain-containing protein [Pseudomonadales bacterium]
MKLKKIFSLLILFVTAVFLSGCSLKKDSKAGLQVITHDVPSSVFIDGQYLNKTPLIEKNLAPGKHTIRIEPEDPDYLPYETEVTLNPGVLTVVTWKSATRPEQMGGVIYEMEKINSKDTSEVSFVTIPDGAIITLAGQEKEFSPVTIPNVQPGQLEYEITLPSYETQSHSIEVAAGYRMIISVKLAKLDPNATRDASQKIPEEELQASESAETTEPPKEESAKEATASGQTLLSISSQLVEITSTNFFQDGKEVLRVRDNPGANGSEIGLAEVGKKYPYLGVEQSGWYKISFETKEGWVSASYAKIIDR